MMIQIEADGIVSIDHSNDTPTYERLSAAVDGYLQALDLAGIAGLEEGQAVMWLNEEGKLNGLPVNNLATALTRHIGLAPNDLIVGNVIITGGVDDEGDTLPLASGDAGALMAHIDLITL
jgi:hypothetical protein